MTRSRSSKRGPAATSSSARASACTASALEANLQAELAVVGVVERSERRRPEIRLDVGRQERRQRVVRADADPRLELEDLEAVLDAGLEPRVGREAQRVARSDEVERVVDDRVRQAAPPVERAEQQPPR